MKRRNSKYKKGGVFHPVLILIAVVLMTLLVCNFIAGGFSGLFNKDGTETVSGRAIVPETGATGFNPLSAATEADEEQPEALPTRAPRQTATFTSAPVEDEHEVMPDELPDLLGYGGWGAGYEGLCEFGNPEVYLEDYFGGGIRALNKGNPIYHGMYTTVVGCFFTPGETVSVTFYLPDGKRSQTIARVGKDGYWKAPWLSLPETPLGKYEAVIESGGSYASLYFEVAEPALPIMTAACDPENAKGRLLLTGFLPGEEVILGRYFLNQETVQAELLDYQYFDIGEEGYLDLEIKNEKNLYIALGSESPREAKYVLETTDEIYDTSAFEFTELPPWPCD